MDCASAKKLLNEYIDGAMPKEARALVEDHLRSCADCDLDVKGLIQVRDVLRAAPVFNAPAGFSARVMKDIRYGKDIRSAEPRLFGWLRDMPMHLKLAEAAAAAVVMAVGIYSAGLFSNRLPGVEAAGEQAEGMAELASLEQIDMVPPGSIGDIYLYAEENGNER